MDQDVQSLQPQPSSERPAARDSSWLFDSDEDDDNDLGKEKRSI